MAEEAQRDDDVFVYTGGDQIVPDDVRHARIDESINTIGAAAFENRQQLVSVEFHDGIEVVEERAFAGCPLRGDVLLKGVRIVRKYAFENVML